MSNINTLNKFIEENISSSSVIQGINDILKEITTDQQLHMHSLLTPLALKTLFELRDELQLNYYAKEHIVWWYFNQNFQNKSGRELDPLLFVLLDEYRKNKYIALESLIVTLINNEGLTTTQIEKAIEIFDFSIIEKPLAGYRVKRKIRHGEALDSNDTAELIRLNNFEVLELALKSELITEEGLRLFNYPDDGARNRKSKLRLYQLAQSQLEKCN